MARTKPAPVVSAADHPEAPESLKDEALLEWHRMLAELAAAGALKRVDRAALTTYCLAWAQMQEAARNIERTGTIIKLPNGYPGPTPYMRVFNDSAKLCTKLLAEFGATPGARARFPDPTGKAAADDDLEI